MWGIPINPPCIVHPVEPRMAANFDIARYPFVFRGRSPMIAAEYTGIIIYANISSVQSFVLR